MGCISFVYYCYNIDKLLVIRDNQLYCVFKIFEDSVILQSVFSSAKQMLEKTGKLPDAATVKRNVPEDNEEPDDVPKKKKKKKRKKHSSDEEEIEEDTDYSD